MNDATHPPKEAHRTTYPSRAVATWRLRRSMLAAAAAIALAALPLAHAQMGIEAMGMDDMGMGPGADVTVLAEGETDTLPSGMIRWMAFEVAAEERIEFDAPADGFLHADRGSVSVSVNGGEHALEPGDALFVRQGDRLTVDGSFTIYLLSEVDADPLDDLEGATHAFASEPLEGVPDAPVALRFLLVELDEGGMTTVHTHPGPEFIYVTQGEIEYETEGQDAETLGPGDARSLPANTAVQKRHTGAAPVAFLSWFVVDPDEPFSPMTTFGSE